MSLSPILAVAISIVFLYLLGSQVVLSIYELWAGYTNSRGKFLYRRLKEILGDTTTRTLYAQKPIAALTPAGQAPPTTSTENTLRWRLGKDGLPAYIPADLFASTFLTMVAPTAINQPSLIAALGTPPEKVSKEAIGLLKGILAGLDAQATLEDCQKKVAAWYDAYGERLTGWYKRQVRLWLFLIGLVVAFVGNIDSPFIIRYLWAHPQLSSALADQATQETQSMSALKIRDAEKKATTLNPDKAASTAGAPVQGVRPTAETDSLKHLVQVSQARIQTLSNRLQGLGFPIGRADSASRDSALLPKVFFVKQPAHEVRRGRVLELVPEYYLRYVRRDTVLAPTAVKGVTSKSTYWQKEALPIEKVSDTVLEGPQNRSEQRHWYLPLFGPQSQSAWHTILGWLLTAAALSVGAPFWFDLLCRLVNIRNLGIKPPRPQQ